MSDEPKHDEPVVAEFKRLLGEVRDLAVAGERERWAVALKVAHSDAYENGDQSLGTALGDVLNKVCSPEPEPPASEPMTIEMVTERLQKRGYVAPDLYDWTRLRADLTALVQAQARRDAELLRTKCAEGSLGREWANDILEAAGLE